MDKNKNLAGFSLIEMSFIIIIFGLIVGTIVPLLVSKIQQDKVREARDVVRMTRDEIIGMIQVDGNECKLPGQDTNTRIDPWGNRVIYQPVVGESIVIDGVVIAFYVLSKGKNNTLDTSNSTHEFYSYGEMSLYSSRPFDDIYDYVTESYISGIYLCSVIVVDDVNKEDEANDES